MHSRTLKPTKSKSSLLNYDLVYLGIYNIHGQENARVSSIMCNCNLKLHIFQLKFFIKHELIACNFCKWL